MTLEKGAVLFCHYSNPHYHALVSPVFMPLAQLEAIIQYALDNGLSINFLYGKHCLPPEYENLINTISHIKMVPQGLYGIYPDGIPVLDAADCESFGGIEQLTKKDLDLYESQLQKISTMLQKDYHEGIETEINLLTDRLLLKQMNKCDAGIKHLTIAPNGKVYICPGFYYDNVPSKEQCLIAHTEREASRKMLNKLRDIKPLDKLPAIACLSYQDPFDVVAQPIGHPATISPTSSGSSTGQDIGVYLDQIFEMQKQILRKLEAT